jgi:hypothetical protein
MAKPVPLASDLVADMEQRVEELEELVQELSAACCFDAALDVLRRLDRDRACEAFDCHGDSPIVEIWPDPTVTQELFWAYSQNWISPGFDAQYEGAVRSAAIDATRRLGLIPRRLIEEASRHDESMILQTQAPDKIAYRIEMGIFNVLRNYDADVLLEAE